MNPCPCGHLGDPSGLCSCTADKVARYHSRVSGPLLDRIDLHVAMGRPKSFLSEHSGPEPEGSREVRERVIAARAIQQERSGCANAQLGPAGIRAHCVITTSDHKLVETASQQFVLSPRACLRILKVARTLADLKAEPDITTDHLAEANSYRNCNALRKNLCQG